MAFDLLQDLWPSLSELEVEGVNASRLDRDLIEHEVRQPLKDALEAVEGPVYTSDVEWLRERTATAVRDDEFCITLDHGVYFPQADFRLDLSRTASDLHHTGSKRLERLPRDVEDLPTQLAGLSSALATSRKRKVILADDGLSTGETLTTIIERCRDYGIEVRRAVVCCNNTELELLADSVRVSSIVRRSPGRPWLNERDLYWGLPRSGQTLASTSRNARSYSIPFSADLDLVRQRICVRHDVEEFRSACLRANQRLWELFEEQAGQWLNCEDCPPLRFVPELLRWENKRVVTFLEELLDGTNALDLKETIPKY